MFFLYFTALYCVKYCDTCNTSYYIVIYSIALWYDFTYLYQSFCSITFHFYCIFHYCCYFVISIVNKINYLITMIIIIVSLLHHHIKILNTITPFNLFIIIFLIFYFFIFFLIPYVPYLQFCMNLPISVPRANICDGATHVIKVIYCIQLCE